MERKYYKLPITKVPAVQSRGLFRLNRSDSNFGLSAFSWDRSDPAAWGNISGINKHNGKKYLYCHHGKTFSSDIDDKKCPFY